MSSPDAPFRSADLAAELTRLRTNHHQSQRTLSKLSAVSNTLISTLESADAAPPHPNILLKLARGIATNGALEVDEQRAEAYYLALMRAAGYMPEASHEHVSSSIEAELAAMFRPDEAPLVAEILRVWAKYPEPTRRFLLNTMRPLVLGVPDGSE